MLTISIALESSGIAAMSDELEAHCTNWHKTWKMHICWLQQNRILAQLRKGWP